MFNALLSIIIAATVFSFNAPSAKAGRIKVFRTETTDFGQTAYEQCQATINKNSLTAAEKQELANLTQQIYFTDVEDRTDEMM